MAENYAEAGYPFDPAAARACFEAEHTWVQRARRILDAASAPLFSGSAGNTAETANV